MHELGITQEIINLLEEEYAGQAAKISKVVLKIGKLTLILPESLSFCFDLCSEGSVAQGASLEILQVEGKGRCRKCGTVFGLEALYGQCPCSFSDFEILEGEELEIFQVEVL